MGVRITVGSTCDRICGDFSLFLSTIVNLLGVVLDVPTALPIGLFSGC